MGLTEITVVLVVLVALGFVLWEMHSRSLRTRIFEIPGGLRFEAQDFKVQILRKEQEVQVSCRRGILTLPAEAPAQEPKEAGPVVNTFAAIGFSMSLRGRTELMPSHPERPRTGPVDIVMRHTDGTQLCIERVNPTVATSFELFYMQVHLWIEKLERRAKRERVQRLRSEEEAAQAQQHAELLAQIVGNKPADQPMSEDERNAAAAAQIAHWRAAAGFEGQHSLHSTDDRGLVTWFVDLAADGRVTLHANKRTLHTTLRGATVASKNGELELGVRDTHWTEEEPELQVFHVLKGRSADERRAWKERLEFLRNRMPAEHPTPSPGQ